MERRVLSKTRLKRGNYHRYIPRTRLFLKFAEFPHLREQLWLLSIEQQRILYSS
ncbi:hypothetical protein LEP1GSC188_3924 [Leptospira weilii serovar Topaz str. LT2116]|uniref:Uncharacterized protein n=1 Tax=Leptospira weilii serovar Topaz str. LT2116 TaxID=1088540 RepID=M3G458_9LEPT|nr:hypothetical protein LEP1GSC188_3924 [Leptospira weilii serovar Topaz str. LT2116]